MKKSIRVLLSLLLCTGLLLAGCKGDTPASTGAASSEVPPAASSGGAAKETTITFGFWGDTKEAEMKMQLAQNFMDANPGVTIEFEYTDGAGYLTKMQTWFSSDTVPDVFGVPSDTLFQFMGNDLFEDLGPYIEKDDLEKVWNMDTVESNYVKDGKVHAAPFISKVFAIAYNKDLFDAAQLEYPTADWTEEDMLKYAELLTQGEGTDKVYGIRWGVRPMEFYRNLYGTPVYDITNNTMNAENNEQFKHAVSMFADTINAGWAPNETSAAISTGGFETGQFGMQLCATWDIATFQSMIGDSFEWDIVMLPKSTEFNTRMRTTYRGNGWSMSSASKEKEVAWDFIKYMTATEEAQKIAQAFGLPEYMPYANGDAYIKDYAGGSAYNKQVFIDMLEHTTSFYNQGVYAQINDVIKTQYELLLAGQTTIDELAREVQQQGEGLLAAA